MDPAFFLSALNPTELDLFLNAEIKIAEECFIMVMSRAIRIAKAILTCGRRINMNKYMKIFGLATALSITSIASVQAQVSSNSHKVATHEEMTTPDDRGHIVVTPNASKAYACTADKYLVRTFLFASAHYKTVGGTNKPLPTQEYMDGLVKVFKETTRKTRAADYDYNNVLFGLADATRNAMNNYTKDFNRPRGTFFDWMYKAWVISPNPHPNCQP